MTKKADHNGPLAGPRYRQIARQIIQSIINGELPAGSRLPSSRVWALALGVSRTTVEHAYGELVAQGWLVRRGQAGTFVGIAPAAASSTADIQHYGGERSHLRPFQLGVPALDLFPRGLWSRIMGQRLRTQTREELTTGDPGGEYALRESIAAYLRLSRSIDCLPEQIFITAGYAMAMQMLLQVLGQPGEGMWVENPGYPLICPVIAHQQIVMHPVPVDGEGMDIGYAERHYPTARFALLTPAHQSPLGVALSLPRRRQLLAWAARQQAWIIEDDYDSEFRYQGKPLPPLKSLDAPQRVIYAGSFSKSLYPALRAAWLVVPVSEVARFRQQAALWPCPVPRLWQLTIGDFIAQGHFWRHLKKMRAAYASRRQWLETALREQGFEVVAQAGGIQLVIEIAGDDRALAQRANDAGLAVQALSHWFRDAPPGKGGLIMSFTNLASLGEAQQAARQLRRAII
ncbi:PLP-dependent aminotransferase family protein [Shimwellia pseudoproteus]|uniref:MocR-like pyridoxine biosynthesis transcription factor PdxR n=1 Tax=Shimwellia pseudoproteus TaxID=570012 RepID=UPI0018EBE0CC|nr:PLP-dependent aminotransferase family protein [Shimwellia pseudoproteus]